MSAVGNLMRRENGQMVIFLVLAMSVFFVIGAVTVDIGLWLSERRGSQTDADFAAMAGAFELLDPASSSADAINSANDSISANDEQGNIPTPVDVQVDDSCWDRGVNDAVTVNVEHRSKALFFSIWGIVNPDIGAHAKACVGAVQAPGDLVPFHVTDNPGPCFDTNEQPLFTSLCPVEKGAHADNPQRGLLDLEAGQYCSNQGGNGDPAEMIENGAPGICLIDEDGVCDGPNDNTGYYDCVFAQAGNTGEILDGVYARVTKDGLCDSNFGDDDGVDEFFESVTKVFDTGNDFTSLYEARDCDPVTDGLQKSPRLVTIIVLEEDADQNDPSPIIAFAGFFLAGCGDERLVWTSEDGLDPDCDAPGAGQNIQPPSDLYVRAPELGPLPRPAACHQNQNPQPHPAGATPCATATPTPTPTPAPTPTPTPTPGPTPGSSATPSPTPSVGSCPPGHCTVFGRFVKLIIAGADVGPPTDQTTLFGISLVE